MRPGRPQKSEPAKAGPTTDGAGTRKRGQRMSKEQQEWLERRKDRMIHMFITEKLTHQEVADRIGGEMGKALSKEPWLVPMK